MRLITPWKYNLVAPLIPKSIKPWVRERVVAHCVRKDMYPVPEREIFKRFIHEGDTVIDVGANIGAYTSVFARLVGEKGHVYAFEPVTPTYRILCRSTARFPQVDWFQVALSDRTGKEEIRLLKADETVGETSLFKSTLEPIWLGDSTTDEVEAVDVGKLDGLPMWNPKLIKCDVEGHDWRVIKGAAWTTKKFRPIWVVEIMVPPEESPIVAYFKKMEYNCYIQKGDTLALRFEGKLSPTNNYFFIPKEGK